MQAIKNDPDFVQFDNPVGDGQAEKVAALLLETGDYERVEKIKDFNDIERVVRARRTA